MHKLKPRHILVFLMAIVLVTGGYMVRKMYQEHQITNPSAQVPPSSGPAVNSTACPAPFSGDYKQLMTPPYQQTLQTMQNVKENTLALQSKKLSIAAYRSSILDAQATLTAAEEFVRTNPPAEETLTPSYREFLAGISLAKESMSVVLKGISTLSSSKLYTAREMGKQAQKQVMDGYSHF